MKNKVGQRHTLSTFSWGQSQLFLVTFCQLGPWSREFSLRSDAKEHYILRPFLNITKYVMFLKEDIIYFLLNGNFVIIMLLFDC